MGLSEFPDTFPPVILHFGGDIGDGSLCVEVPLIHCHRRRFRFLRPFENRLYAHSLQGLVMEDLLKNFLNPLKLLLAMTNDFPESP
jgi:hypothetical protein